MNTEERSEKLLGMLRRHNAEVNSLVEDWRSSQEVECKDQEIKIEPFGGKDVSIRFRRDPYIQHPHTHLEIWVRGVSKGNFHISEDKLEFFGYNGADSLYGKL